MFFFLLLWPFSVLYNGVMRLRNFLYDAGLRPAASFHVPLIAVGNLAAGGTGKTPMTEYLIKLLLPHAKPAVLSRGYGRKTRGLLFASPEAAPADVGDEPLQIYKKFQVPVAVCEDRVYAIPHILQQHDDVGAIILDDAFQHRRLKAGFYVLLTDYARLFYHDYLLPAGRLRERREGARRAQVVVVTKCPEHLTESEMEKIKRAIGQYTPAPVFFSYLKYGEPKPLHDTAAVPSGKIILVTGIAYPETLLAWARDRFNVVRHFHFPDHHVYTAADVHKLKRYLEQQNGQVSILTTEKDAVKLSGLNGAAGLPIFVLPVQIDFLKNGKEFDNLVLNYVLGPVK